MAYTSFGTRKALGRRYAIDPALQMEAERLQNEYNLVPGREARALQASQFQQQIDQNDKNQQQQAKAGMVGTVANTLTTGATLRALTMNKGDKFFGNWGSNASVQPSGMTATYSNGAVANPSVGQIGGGTSLPEGMNGGSTYTFGSSVNPATTDAALSTEATGGGVGTATGAETSGMTATGTATGTTAAGSTSAATVPVIGAIIAGAMATKEGAKQYTDRGGPLGYAARTAQHPVGGVLTPGMTLVDNGLIDKDSAVGKIISGPSNIEEKVMDWIGSWF